MGSCGSVCGAEPSLRRQGAPRQGIWAPRVSGTVGVWAWRDTAWAICGASLAPSGCCLCGQLTSRGCRRPRALLLQLRKGMGVAGGTGGAGAQSPEALCAAPQAALACPVMLRGPAGQVGRPVGGHDPGRVGLRSDLWSPAECLGWAPSAQGAPDQPGQCCPPTREKGKTRGGLGRRGARPDFIKVARGS